MTRRRPYERWEIEAVRFGLGNVSDPPPDWEERRHQCDRRSLGRKRFGPNRTGRFKNRNRKFKRSLK